MSENKNVYGFAQNKALKPVLATEFLKTYTFNLTLISEAQYGIRYAKHTFKIPSEYSAERFRVLEVRLAGYAACIPKYYKGVSTGLSADVRVSSGNVDICVVATNTSYDKVSVEILALLLPNKE